MCPTHIVIARTNIFFFKCAISLNKLDTMRGNNSVHALLNNDINCFTN